MTPPNGDYYRLTTCTYVGCQPNLFVVWTTDEANEFNLAEHPNMRTHKLLFVAIYNIHVPCAIAMAYKSP